MGELGSVAMCRRIFKYQTTESGDIPFFKIGSFGGTPDAFISKDLFESFKVKYPYPEKGDVLISASGSIGRTVVFTGKDEYFQDSNIVWLKHNNSIINSFLNYLYSTVKWAGIEGTTIKRLYNDNILKTEAIIPTLLEQQKISDYLDGINHLITLHQSKSFGYIFKAIVSFTLYWEQRKLGEFGKATGGISIESEFDEHGKYKVISIGSYSEESKYTDQGIRVYKTKKTESRILNKNDLVMILNDKTSSGNIIGRVLLVDKDNTYVYNQRTERIEINKSKFLPEYLYQLLNSDNIREKIICASQGNTQIYVNWTIIREFTYKITTDIEEQGKIARFFISLDHLITLHQLEPFQLIFKAIAYRIIDYAKSKPPRHTKYEITISFIKYYI